MTAGYGLFHTFTIVEVKFFNGSSPDPRELSTALAALRQSLNGVHHLCDDNLVVQCRFNKNSTCNIFFVNNNVF